MASYEQAKSLLTYSVARPTLYSLEFTGKNIVGNEVTRQSNSRGFTSGQSEYFKLFCDNIEFPGMDYEQAISIGQEAMGINRGVPAGLMYTTGNRLVFSVIENSDFTVYDSLRQLFNAACAEGGNPRGTQRAQRMSYYDDYKFDVTLKKLEFPNKENDIKRGDKYAVDYGYKVVATYLFENCYISAIGSVNYNSGNVNTYMSFTSTIKFESFHHDNTKYMYDG